MYMKMLRQSAPVDEVSLLQHVEVDDDADCDCDYGVKSDLGCSQKTRVR